MTESQHLPRKSHAASRKPSSFERLCRGLRLCADGLLAFGLFGMVVAVFANVVMRYFFNTGIASYEEASRLLFVWLVSVGAVLTAFERQHLGFDLVLRRLSLRAQQVCELISQLLVIGLVSLVAYGAWEQVLAGLNSFSTVLRYPLALNAAAILLMSIGLAVAAVTALVRLGQTATRRASEDQEAQP